MTSLGFLEKCFETIPYDDIFTPFRNKAYERFVENGFPQKKRDFKDLLEQEFFLPEKMEIEQQVCCNISVKESKGSCIVFVDGFLDEKLSNFKADCVFLSLHDAMQSYGILLQNRLSKGIKEEKDPFALINMAFCQTGAFIYVPPEKKIETPLQILHIITGKNPSIFCPRTHIFLGKNASLNCLSQVFLLEKKEAFLYSNMVDVTLEEEANFDYHSIVDGVDTGYLYENMRVLSKKRSKSNIFTFTTGSKIAEKNYEVSLVDEEAQTELKGLNFLDNNSISNTTILVKHLAPNCISNQFFKGVLKDQSKTTFAGKIYVEPIAQQTHSYQLNKNLLLSDDAVAISKPDLEILADDVKASHGATVTELNEEEIFYLNSRGVKTKAAKQLLTRGFCREIIDGFKISSLKNKITKIITC